MLERLYDACYRRPVRGRGGAPARGVPTRGATLGRGGRGLAPRPAPVPRHQPMPVYEEESYAPGGYEDTSYDSYGNETYETQSYAGAG